MDQITYTFIGHIVEVGIGGRVSLQLCAQQNTKQARIKGERIELLLMDANSLILAQRAAKHCHSGAASAQLYQATVSELPEAPNEILFATLRLCEAKAQKANATKQTANTRAGCGHTQNHLPM